MQHVINADYTAAKGGCYLCTNPNDCVATDAVIEGEGVLVLCTACILDMAQLARAGRARIALVNKRASAADAAKRAKYATPPPAKHTTKKVAVDA
jgi:hypothetical protein